MLLNKQVVIFLVFFMRDELCALHLRHLKGVPNSRHI